MTTYVTINTQYLVRAVRAAGVTLSKKTARGMGVPASVSARSRGKDSPGSRRAPAITSNLSEISLLTQAISQKIRKNLKQLEDCEGDLHVARSPRRGRQAGTPGTA